MTDNAAQPPDQSLSRAEIERYQRHLSLPQVGPEGQRKLKQASVLVVGTGGLGSPIALYLAAAGVGRIGLVDYDVVDATNLQRQIVHGDSTLGMPKVESAAQRLRELNPFTTVETHHVALTSANALDILRGYDIITDGTDNFATRYLLNDASLMLGKRLVYGSIYRFEGQVSVFGAPDGPCYRCLQPTPPPPHLVPSCAEAGVLGVLPGTVGTIQATEAIKLILGIGEPLVGRLLLYDALDMSFDFITLPKRQDCPMCGEHPTITALIDYDEFCGAPGHAAHDEMANVSQQGTAEISVEELRARLHTGRGPILLDVREPYELRLSQLPGAINIPMSQMQSRWQEIPTGEPVVVFCHHGTRSRYLVEELAAAGFGNLINLRGGIDAWSRRIDPSVPRY